MPRHIRFAAWLTLALALVPALALAQAGTQLRLSWDHCAAEGYIADRSFACNTNAGEDVVVLSAVLGDEVPHSNLSGFDAIVDFRATSASLPSWWQVGSGMCRFNAILVQATNLVASPLCTPWYLAGGGVQEPLAVVGFVFGIGGINAMQAQLAAAVPAGTEVTLPGGPQEYLFARVRILHAKTAGTGACEGCTVPVCIGFGQLKLRNSASDHTILGTTASTVTWQGAYVSSYQPVPGHFDLGGYIPYYGNLGCATGPVPAQGRTWGTIKTLYR